MYVSVCQVFNSLGDKDEALTLLSLISAFSICSLAIGIFLSGLSVEACTGAFNPM